MRIIRAMIIDDEPLARDELEYLLGRHADVQVVYKTGNPKEVLNAIDKYHPHLVFLDIRMPGIDGLQTAETIIENQLSPLIVFATAYEEFAVKAFEIDAVDYLLKPFSPKRIDRCLDRVRTLLNTTYEINQQKLSEVMSLITSPNPRRKLAVDVNGKAVIIDAKDIILACCCDGQLAIYTIDSRYQTNMTLQDLQLRLDERQFFRSHRAYLVNVEKIREVIPWFNGTFNLILEGLSDIEVPVSRQHSPKLKRMFGL